MILADTAITCVLATAVFTRATEKRGFLARSTGKEAVRNRERRVESERETSLKEKSQRPMNTPRLKACRIQDRERAAARCVQPQTRIRRNVYPSVVYASMLTVTLVSILSITPALASEIAWQRGWNLLMIPASWDRAEFPEDVRLWRFQDRPLVGQPKTVQTVIERVSPGEGNRDGLTGGEPKPALMWLHGNHGGQITIPDPGPSAIRRQRPGQHGLTTSIPARHPDLRAGFLDLEAGFLADWDAGSQRYVRVLGNQVSGPNREWVENHIEGNLKKALELRAALLKPASSDSGQWVQAEYEQPTEAPPVTSGANTTQNSTGDLTYRDAQVLAGFDRVWVYTQGIALHQRARRHENEPAKGLARWLCDPAQAVWDGDQILGWAFSKNTNKDHWRDVRLVTGASAWAIHGLGAFLGSDAFFELEAVEQTHFRRCYLAALRGLERHRVRVDLSSGLKGPGVDGCEANACGTLMTAGWTTQGLLHRDQPWILGLTDDSTERFAYYDVLDALGYDGFEAERPPTIRRTQQTKEGLMPVADPFVPTLSQFETLKKRVPA